MPQTAALKLKPFALIDDRHHDQQLQLDGYQMI
jgi:hypothetical protein